MREAIIDFPKQLEFEPIIGNAERWKKSDRFIVAGMGGSHLAADLLKMWKPELNLIVHSNYGLPRMPPKELSEYSLIASSYSGNTEECLDSYDAATDTSMSVAAVAIGAELLARAKKDGVTFVQIPDTGIQPRMATGFSFRALLKLMGEETALGETSALAEKIKPLETEKQGKELAERLRGKVPVIYSSQENWPLAYNWKAKFNETGKIPAFYNVLPELNHNEINGFDASDGTHELCERFAFIFLKDTADHPRTKIRAKVLEKMYAQRDLQVISVDISRESVFEKMFSALILADWAALYTAQTYGVDPEPVPMVEEFKKLIVE